MAYTPASRTAGLSLPSCSAAAANRSLSTGALLPKRLAQLLTLLRGSLFGIPASCAVSKVLCGQGTYQGQPADTSCDPRGDDRRVHTRNLAHYGRAHAGHLVRSPLSPLTPMGATPRPTVARCRRTANQGPVTAGRQGRNTRRAETDAALSRGSSMQRQWSTYWQDEHFGHPSTAVDAGRT
jgi:hypothetical protein